MIRKCNICGRRLNIILNRDKTYEGGHYFGKVDVNEGNGDYVKIRTSKFLGKKTNIVRWTGKTRKAEYWECDKCFNAPDN